MKSIGSREDGDKEKKDGRSSNGNGTKKELGKSMVGEDDKVVDENSKKEVEAAKEELLLAYR